MQKDISDSEALLRQASAMDTSRRIMMLLNAITYVMWMVGLAMNTGTPESTLANVWRTLQTLGPILWGLSIIGLSWTLYRAWQRRDLTALVEDERTKDRTLRAFQVGYIVLLFPLAAIYTASYLTAVDIRFVMPLLMAVGVATPSVAYALFLRS